MSGSPSTFTSYVLDGLSNKFHLLNFNGERENNGNGGDAFKEVLKLFVRDYPVLSTEYPMSQMIWSSTPKAKVKLDKTWTMRLSYSCLMFFS
ncbi:hypothetical protein TIFTF001_035010 [Ficus carica]|uniref:Uncharacterized protein n=1 Tax=Ficus carica TaxID=3494 RepID=A0AA88J9C9_FICCA|nr:hypothetical protein TIFTF001_035010 [Ficus carica]